MRASLLAFMLHGGKDAGQIRKEMRKAQLAKVAESGSTRTRHPRVPAVAKTVEAANLAEGQRRGDK